MKVKVEVTVPDGIYCGLCPFLIDDSNKTATERFCVLFDAEMELTAILEPYLVYDCMKCSKCLNAKA